MNNDVPLWRTRDAMEKWEAGEVETKTPLTASSARMSSSVRDIPEKLLKGLLI